MKKNDFISLMMTAIVSVAALTFVSCEDKIEVNGNGNEKTNSPSLYVNTQNLDFKLGDAPKEVKVITQEEWEYSVDEDWAHVSREDGGDKLLVEVDNNRSKETRECLLTIHALRDTEKKYLKTVKIKQTTSLITIFCKETEVNLSHYEGASSMVNIESNGDWSVRSTPEWIRPSVSKGSGNKCITFTTLSANKSSSNRTGTVVIGTSDDEVQVEVNQYGSAIADCLVTPKNITVLSNGIAFDMDYRRAGNVAHYYRGYMEASRVGSMTNPEIISTLQREFKRHLPSDDEVADFSGLLPNKEYVIYTLAYDMEGKRGDLFSQKVKTRPIVVNDPCGWISDMRYENSYWKWYITKNATCYSYWMMVTEDPDLAYASDVLQAWWLEDAVRRHQETEYYNGGNWNARRVGGNMVAVWTRGRSADGTLAGIISWDKTTSSSSAKTRGNRIDPSMLQTQTKRNTSGDHSGKKLREDQFQLYVIE